MVTLVTRSGKGSPLTHAEVDSNFTNLDAGITALAPFYGVLAADYTLTSTVSVQPLFNWSAGGALTLATGIYEFRCFFQMTNMSATSGNAVFDLLGAGSATLARVLQMSSGRDGVIGNPPTNMSGALVATNAFNTNTVAAAVATQMETGIWGTFDVTATGTIIPSVALTTASAATVKAGASFVCRKIGETGVATYGTWS